MPETTETTKKPAVSAKPAQHNHPAGYREMLYYSSCRACQAEDDKRSGVDKAPLYTEEELQEFTFLYPEDSYEGQICQSYLEQRYPYAPFSGSQFPLSMFLQLPKGNKLVVLKRVARPGRPMGVRFKTTVDEYTKQLRDEEFSPNQYVSQVVESAPLDISDALVRVQSSRFDRASLDYRELLDRLSDLCGPSFRLEVSRLGEVNGLSDFLVRMVRA